MHGPGVWPHRMTVVRGKHDELPQDQGRHNMLYVMIYFSSVHYPDPEPSHDIVFRNCVIENAHAFLHYRPDVELLQFGTHLVDLTLENVRFLGLNQQSDVCAPAEAPLHITMKNVEVGFREDAASPIGLFDGKDPHTRITEA